MDLAKLIIDEIYKQQGHTFKTQQELAQRSGLDQSTVSRILQRKESMNLKTANALLDGLNADISFIPTTDYLDESIDKAKEGIQLRFPSYDLTTYIPIPIFDRFNFPVNKKLSEVANKEVKYWTFTHSAPQLNDTEIVGYEITQEDFGMAPLLRPGDWAFVDLNERTKVYQPPNNLYLVKTPPPYNQLLIRWIDLSYEDGDYLCILYPESRYRYPAKIYSLSKHYNNDIKEFIVGMVRFSNIRFDAL